MSDAELVKKMLGSILQANKGGVSLSRLQTEYKALTGEHIPHKQLGHSQLDMLLASMPSVVHVEHGRSGEMVYYAAVTNKRAHIAKFVARQRGSRKTGQHHLVNTQMRVKPGAPLILNAKPQTSLRQPNHRGRGGGRAGGGGGGGGGGGSHGSGHGDFRQTREMRDGQSDSKHVSHPTKAANPSTAGRRASQPAEKSDKRMTLPSRFQREVQTHLSRNSQHSSSPSNLNDGHCAAKGKLYNPEQAQNRIKEILGKYSNGFWVSKLPRIYMELYKQDLPTEAIKDLETWTHICTVERTCGSNSSELLLYPAKEKRNSSSPSPVPNISTEQKSHANHLIRSTPDPSSSSQSSISSSSPSPPSSPAAISPDLKEKMEELLLKYSNGLWAHALPKLFQDTYKTKLPGHVLENLQLLSDICTIDYPMPDNPKKAILYRRSSSGSRQKEDENCNRRVSSASAEELRQREGLRRIPCTQEVPSLQIPKEEYPSVLVVEATNTNGVLLRYIGDGYSKAQESMEDEMREFYSVEKRNAVSLSHPSAGQLAAVIAEEVEVLRAQVCEVTVDKVKVYYVDHGFTEVVCTSKVLQLHERFYKLPFQATKCKLAGLERFSQESEVLKRFEEMASGKILLAEILERSETPLVVLYDTSQDDDVNINAACMKALQDKTLASPLKVNGVYMNVTVSSVCSDGTFYCQLPCRGLAMLSETLEKIESHFHSQVTSDFLVSQPFCGKGCLARYKGKWSRVEISNLHGSRVLDIQFVDLGVHASVEVFELREIPTLFLRNLMAIPPQAMRCCLADLTVSVGWWTPDAVQWLRDRVLHSADCSMKVAKVDTTKNCTHVHLFTDKNFHNPANSLNHQMLESELFKKKPDVFLTSQSPTKITTPTLPATTFSTCERTNGSPSQPRVVLKPQLRRTLSGTGGTMTKTSSSSPSSAQLPPPLQLPPAGSNLDVYVSVACHPGHFVLQPWRDMYKLVVLMGEMILYYNKTEETPLSVEKNQIYAAKVENNWHRVLVKGVLINGLVSVYELDYGKHELVSCTQFRPLIQEFRQLPFQGMLAQLAGMKPRQWSEEASIFFRNHVEKKPLVAQLEAVQEAVHPWDRKLTVFLVDTSQEERDIWVHDIMSEFVEEVTN